MIRNKASGIYSGLLRVSFLFFFIFLSLVYSIAQNVNRKKSSKGPADTSLPAISINIENALACFNKGNDNAEYRIILCADVPYNKKPMRVAYHQETGHVFLILQKINKEQADTLQQVFGFYRIKGCLLCL